VHQAHHLESLVRTHPALELLAPVPLNIVNFRYAPAGVAPAALDALNKRDPDPAAGARDRGAERDDGRGKFAIRVAITNHRSRDEDFDALVDAVVAIGEEIAARG
jgi:aromatic-L-amino-acid/L-tryptophan decarboxylase